MNLFAIIFIQWSMERVEGRRLSIEALNERRRRAVKMRLSGATIMETVAQCELGRSAVIRASQAYKHGGWKAVSVSAGGRPKGSGRLFSPAEEQEVQWLIQDRTDRKSTRLNSSH